MRSSVDLFRELLAEEPPVRLLADLYAAAGVEREEPEVCAILARALMAVERYERTPHGRPYPGV